MNLNFSLQQIIDLDEKNQIMTTNIWLSLYWHDTYMTWEPEDYGGITVNKMYLQLFSQFSYSGHQS